MATGGRGRRQKSESEAETSEIVALAADLRRQLDGAPTSRDDFDRLQESLERLWRALEERRYELVKETTKGVSFPKTGESVRLSIPFPPTLNHNVLRYGKRYFRDKDYETFLRAVWMIWRTSRPKDWDPARRFAVAIRLFYDSRRRFDVDNRVKPILDALTKAGAWHDDSQVDLIVAARDRIDKARPRAEIVVRTCEPTDILNLMGVKE